jgi:hypothetical protein
MKQILVISYSQSGQLHEILDYFLEPFKKNGGIQIEEVRIHAKTAYVFPWTSPVFFDTMPETVLEEKIELENFEIKEQKYDLIILGYQPWFLSPSLPTTSLLQDSRFLNVLKHTPVVTVIGSRNMWINSQISVVNQVERAGGNMVANIPLIDRHQNHISALTILHWMLTARKEKKWGILPLPGISKEDIEGVRTFGVPVLEALESGNYKGLQARILEQNKIDILPSIILIEKKAKRLFLIWANLVKRKGVNEKKRAFWTQLYKYYLLIALFVVSPIVLTIYTLLIRPFIGSRINKDRESFLYLGIDKS